MNVSSEFISIGGNRNPAAADWDEGGLQLLAFGADNSIALWDPQVSQPCFGSTLPDLVKGCTTPWSTGDFEWPYQARQCCQVFLHKFR
jgi:hypothetical protein